MKFLLKGHNKEGMGKAWEWRHQVRQPRARIATSYAAVLETPRISSNSFPATVPPPPLRPFFSFRGCPRLRFEFPLALPFDH